MKTIKISGKVIKGKCLGRTIGFPTANLKYNDNINIETGVYISIIKIDNDAKLYPAITNIGLHPTFPEGDKTIETHILNLCLNIYNNNITLYIIKKIREEIKFSNKEQLICQISKDKIFAENFLAKYTDLNHFIQHSK